MTTNVNAGARSDLALFVLGMHRSGTSAVAGALSHLGYHPGDSLLPAVAGVNDSGFYEDERTVAINDAALAAWERDWRVPLPLPADWQMEPALTALRPGIRDLLRAQCSHDRWLLKDPRFCQLLPLWLREAEALTLEPRVVLVYRDPAPVAHSLAARDELDWVAAQHLWARYLLDAERASRGLPRLLLRYDDLLAEPEATLNTLGAWLQGEAWSGASAAALDFVTPTARHHVAAPDDLPLEPLVLRLAALFNTPDVLQRDSLAAELDALHDELQAGLNTLAPLISSQWRTTQALETNFEQALAQLREREQTTLALQDSAVTSDSVAQGAYASAQEAMRQLDVKEATLQRVRSDLSSQVQVAANAHAAARATATELTGTQAELQDVRAELAEFRVYAQELLGARELLPDSPGDAENAEEPVNDYQGSIDLMAENNSHTRVVRYIREAANGAPKRILEVGCSAGYLGAALRSDGHEVWGIEMNPTAATAARQVLNTVFEGSMEAFLLVAEHTDVRFDFILFGDVLEHLLHPDRVLRAASQRLTATGAFIASVPNVAHERMRLMLLEGRWDYSTTGIMDRTHLHFFTRDSLVDLMSEANLAIERLSVITLVDDAVGIAVNSRLAEALAPFINDREKDVFQFIVMARPAAAADVARANAPFSLRATHKLLCLPPLPDSSLYSIRLGDPLERLTQLYGGEVRVAATFSCTSEDIEWADTVVLQREANEPTMELVRRLRRMGKRVVFDLDDYLLEVPEYLAVHEHCKAMRPALERLLGEVDAVSVSTAPLRDLVVRYNRRTYLTPNYAWSNHPPITHSAEGPPDASDDEREELKRVRIIVASSDSVRVDFLVGALRRIQADPRLNVQVIGIGPPGLELRAAGVELDHTGNMSHEQFKAYLASRPNTIALIPLDDNEFNRCKSAVKFFDYALAGVPCVCSAVAPYTAVIDDPDNGILCVDDEDAWVRAIKVLVQGPDRRTSVANTARARCLRHHTLNHAANAWQEMLLDTRFPDADPLYAEGGPPLHQRSRRQLLAGTVRHLLRPSSYTSAWRILRSEGVKGLREKWKLVF